MKIIKRIENGTAVLFIDGQLTAQVVSFFDETLKKALGEDKQIILDFKNVEFIASAVLRVLLTVEKKLKLAKGGITIRNANEVVMEVFRLTGLKDFLTIV